MIDKISELVETYQEWLKAKTTIRAIERKVEITTPFLDRHNDCIQIYAAERGDGFLLSDDGETIADLEGSGISLDVSTRKNLLNLIMRGFGASLEKNVISIETSSENFPLAKHNLVQTILAVNDLSFTARSNVANLFMEEVKLWLKDTKVTAGTPYPGKSGFSHKFHFSIPKSATQPDRFVQMIKTPNKDAAGALVFSWIDTEEVRPKDSIGFAVINDNHPTARPEVVANVIEALSEYKIEPIEWSKRNEFIRKLEA